MKNYVCGFLFAPCRDYVALIRKNKPDWQRGKLNGIGGSVEDGETPDQAMVREFMEEAGPIIKTWECFCIVEYPALDCRVFFYKAFLTDEAEAKTVTSKTPEPVGWYFNPHWGQSWLNLIPNLRWLIPMALTDDKCNVISHFDPTK